MVSRMKLALSSGSMMIAGTVLGCGGVEYPGDQQSWTLRTTPNALSDAPAGALTLIDDGTVKMFESDASSDLISDSNYTIDWAGTWEFADGTTTLDLGCASADSKNAPTVDCDAATLKLTCTLSNRVLDCGDYTFE